MVDKQPKPNLEKADPGVRGPARFHLRFTMLADWHIGSGTGRPGDIDRLVQRDSDGLPYLPAKTVIGIWRDAAEQLAYGLDNGHPKGPWARLVERVFGNQPALPEAVVDIAPNGSLLKSSAAHYPENLRLHIRSKIEEIAKQESGGDKAKYKLFKLRLARQIVASAAIVKPGVSIDPSTGQARTDFLRNEEMGRKGTVLKAEASFDSDTLSENERDFATALLLGSAHLVERVGGKRRRGAGLCRMSVELSENSADLSLPESAIDWLRKNAEHLKSSEYLNGEDRSSGREMSDQTDLNFESPSDTAEWWSIPLTLKLTAPLAVTARTLGNVSETLDYLPGTYLLHHVTRTLNEVGYDCRLAIARGDVQVLPATIDVNGDRGLPVPLALFRKKADGSLDKQGTVFNRQREPAPDEQLKGYRVGYVSGFTFDPGDNTKSRLPSHKVTPLYLGTHNTVEDRYQRPTEDVGGVYSWQAIAAGTVLRSELRLNDDIKSALDAIDPKWWELLSSSDLRLGSSSKDDYGAVDLSVEEPKSVFSEPRIENDILSVWLLSDMLLRESSLKSTTDVGRLAQALSHELDVELEDHQPTKGLLGSLIRARRIESWQVSWGFPRPSLLTLQAGSCAVFKIKNMPKSEKLNQLHDRLQVIERRGLGDRRAEGYGQVQFNSPLLTKPVNGWQKAITADYDNHFDVSPKSPLSKEDLQILERLETAIWRREMRQKILGFAADESKRTTNLGWTKSKPPSSQLGSLRDIVSQMHSGTDRVKVLAWLKHLRATKNRIDRWPADALTQIESLITVDDHVWKLIAPKNQPTLTLTNGAVTRLKGELWAEAVRGLIEASVRQHKRGTE